MTIQTLTPARDARWQTRRVRAGGREHLVRVLPTPSGYRCLPDRPTLALSGDGTPRFGLTLLLERDPTPAAPSLWSLVDHGLVNVVLETRVPAEVLDALGRALGAPCAPLVAQRTSFELAIGGRRLVQASVAAGPCPLTAVLERDAALAVLAAVQGGPSELTVAAVATHRRAAAAAGGPREETIRIAAPLGAVLQPALAGRPGRLVRLVAPGADGARVRDVPSLVRSATRGPVGRSVSLVDRGAFVESMALALGPRRAPAGGAHALLAGDAVRPFLATAVLGAWLADDVVVAPDAAGVSLPLVEDAGAAVFPDRTVADRRWYAPAFALALPAPGDDPATSPFRLSLASGGSVSTPAGLAPGLEGDLLLTVVPGAPAEAGASALPMGSPSVILEVPFRESGSPDTRTHQFVADVDQAADGTLTARVDLLDDWVRLTYGALSAPGFQAQPARLRIAYAFRAYVPVRPQSDLAIVFGRKVARIEIGTPAERAVPGRPVFDPAAVAVRNGAAVLRLTREAGPRRRLRPERITVADGGAAAPSPHRLAPSPHVMAAPIPGVIMLPRPPIVAPDPPVRPDRPRQYVIQTIVREQVLDVVVPCSTHGGFYLQRTPQGDVPVGCQDVLRLGETDYRQYAELGDLATPAFRVFRSLQQPGRFLVLPATYRITRYGPDEPADRAFRPAILLYGIVDRPPDPDRYFLGASLQPDIGPCALRDLRRALVPLTPFGHEPVLDLPTDPNVQAATAFAWALPDGIERPEVRQVWDAFQVSVSTGLVNALALTTLIETSGLEGGVDFVLPSGMRLTSRLVLDTRITGPWRTGPITVQADGTAATLVNRCEQALQVSEIVIGPDDRRIAIDATVAAGASVTVPVDGAAGEACVNFTHVPAALKLSELNVFVEDVKANVMIVNLVAYANHGLTALEIAARLQGTEHAYGLTLADGESGAIELTLPLTTYLHNQVLELQVTEHRTTGQAVPGPWRSWDLGHQGTVISLTPDLLQNTPDEGRGHV